MANEIVSTPNGRSPSPEIDKVSQKTGIRCENVFTVRAGGYSIELVSDYAERLHGARCWANTSSECAERLLERFRWAIARSAASSVCA